MLKLCKDCSLLAVAILLAAPGPGGDVLKALVVFFVVLACFGVVLCFWLWFDQEKTIWWIFTLESNDRVDLKN